MKLPVNYTYQVQYMPPRAQNPRHMPMTASAVFDIEELDPAETEHVANVTERKDYLHSDEKFARKKGESVRILLANGSFWREDTTVDRLLRMGEGGNIETGHLSHIARHSTQSTECGDVKDLSNAARTMKVLSYVPHERWNDDGGAKVAENFRQRLKQMAIFDGSIFVRTPVPVIVLGTRSYHAGFGIGMGRSYDTGEESHYSEWDGAPNSFNLDQLAEAKKFYKLTKGPDDRERIKVEIEILRPGIWEVASHRNAVTGVAKEALEAMMREPQHNTVELMDKAYDLRDALVEAAGEVTPMLIQVLEDLKAMQPPSEAKKATWLEQAGQYDGQHHGKGRSHFLAEKATAMVEEIREIAGRALLRWEMRDPNASWEHRTEACPAVWNDQGSIHQILTLSDARALERLHGVDLSEEIAACVEGRGRLHAAVDGTGGLHLRSRSSHVLLGEDEDGAFRLIAASPNADLNRISDVVAELTGRTVAPSLSAPAPAPSGGM